MKKKIILVAMLFGLGLMFIQFDFSTTASTLLEFGAFIPSQPPALASGGLAQQPKIVLRSDGPVDFCLVIDPNTNTFCWRFPDGFTIQGKVMIEQLPITQTLVFEGGSGIAFFRGSASLDSRVGSAELKLLNSSVTIRDSNIDDSECDCSKNVDFSVDSTADEPDANPGDGACQTASGNCTFLASLQELNATPGGEPLTIGFGGLSPGMNWFRPLIPYPTITHPVNIDGTTHPDGWVVLDGSRTSNGNGLSFTSGGNSVLGTTIINFLRSGVQFRGGGGSVIQWCSIGTDGTRALGNGDDGVWVIDSPDNTIRFCIISGNDQNGVSLIGIGATGNWVVNNNIGTNAQGDSCVANKVENVSVSSPNNWFMDNVMGCAESSVKGLDARWNMFIDNFFGTNDLPCIADLGSPGAALGFGGGASHNMVIGNVITNNRIGLIAFPDSRDNVFSRNYIFSNGDMGINKDFNSGPVVTPGFPELMAARQSASTTIAGRLRSQRNRTFRIEFFSNTECDPSGHGEGQFFIGSTEVATNFFGSVNFEVILPVTVPGGQFMTATATRLEPDQDNVLQPTDTSEFSQCVEVTGTAQPEMALTMTGPSSLRCGLEFFTYSITAGNNGPASALGVIVSDTLPECLIGSQITTTQGRFTFRGRTVTADLGTLDPGASATITIKTSGIPDCAPTMTNTASLSVANDTDPENNTATVNTSVTCGSQISGAVVNQAVGGTRRGAPAGSLAESLIGGGTRANDALPTPYRMSTNETGGVKARRSPQQKLKRRKDDE